MVLVMKWCILMALLQVLLRKVRVVLSAIACINNFCINGRDMDLKNLQVMPIYNLPAVHQAPHEPDILGYIPTDGLRWLALRVSQHYVNLLPTKLSTII